MKRSRRNNPSTIGPNARVSYEDFLSIIYKYGAPHALQIHVEPDLYRKDEYFVYITGQTLKPNVLEGRRTKRFQLRLNRAYEDGVQPEQIENFRNMFFITDPDARFFQGCREVPY
jgi:hypothetical protein